MRSAFVPVRSAQMKDTQTLIINPDQDSIAGEVLRRALEQSVTPLTARQLRERLTGPYKLPLDQIERRLEAEVASGRAFRYAGSGPGGRPRYWTRGLEHFAREAILRILATRALSMAEILRRLRPSLRGMEEAAQRRLIGGMVREGLLHEWPAVIGGRTASFCTLPPDPRFYLEDAVRRIARRLGLPPASLAAPLRDLAGQTIAADEVAGGNLDEKLLERMVQVKLAAAQGAPLPLRELWQSLRAEGWEKSAFDRIVLGLAAGYRVTLLKHDFPGMLSATDRADLVVDQYGNHFVGIALR